MTGIRQKTMRDALITLVHQRMRKDENIFFLTADMGAPVLDAVRSEFTDRCLNVGIAEQNLVNVSAGLALEGFNVYAYAIAPFFLRAYEQIRINLSLASHLRDINVNMMGVGVGVSYDISGPTHHCLEDITIMRAQPNLLVCSPADWVTAAKFADYTFNIRKPKYIRFDSKPHVAVYDEDAEIDFDLGFHELKLGDDTCLVTTSYMTRKAMLLAAENPEMDFGIVDMFMLNSANEDALYQTLSKYRRVLTLEEAFIHRGGVDSLVAGVLSDRDSEIKLERFGFNNQYFFKYGDRDYLHSLAGFGKEDILAAVRRA